MGVFKPRNERPPEPPRKSRGEILLARLTAYPKDGSLNLEAARLELRELRISNPMDPKLDDVELQIRHAAGIADFMAISAEVPHEPSSGLKDTASASAAATALEQLMQAKRARRVHPDAAWIAYVGIAVKDANDPALKALRAFADECIDTRDFKEVKRRSDLAFAMTGIPSEEWDDSKALSRLKQRAADAVEEALRAQVAAEMEHSQRERELHRLADVEAEARIHREREDERLRQEKEYLRAEEERLHEEGERLREERWLCRPAPKPLPQPFGVSHRGAESLICAWMRHLGVLDAEVTQFVGDGGIDVSSADFIAQVKNYAGSIPVAAVRELFGVAVAESKHPLLFTSGMMTVEGNAFASRVGMAVFRYNAEEGTLEGLNGKGIEAVEFSLSDAFRS